MNERGPVLIDLSDQALPDVAAAPEIDAPEGAAMQGALAGMARGGTSLMRWLLGTALSLVLVLAGVALWDFAAAMVARLPVLGWAVAVLSALLVAVLLAMAAREALGLARLSRLDRLRRDADAALQTGDLTAARKVAGQVAALHGARDAAPEALDAAAAIEGAEAALLIGLDARAVAVVQASARQVAMATALVPLPLADIGAALAVNLRMMRQIAEIYGGRPGTLRNWRLARAVAGHLLATGALAVGDELIGQLAGGGLVAKLSRRFGEGVVNGALTARVGLAAMDLCRPLPWRMGRRPGVSATTAAALAGLFGRG